MASGEVSLLLRAPSRGSARTRGGGWGRRPCRLRRGRRRRVAGADTRLVSRRARCGRRGLSGQACGGLNTVDQAAHIAKAGLRASTGGTVGLGAGDVRCAGLLGAAEGRRLGGVPAAHFRLDTVMAAGKDQLLDQRAELYHAWRSARTTVPRTHSVRSVRSTAARSHWVRPGLHRQASGSNCQYCYC